ncbi:hypothetical protein ACTVZO_00005 [Streptomyces sp. IBSNAI002]|uniref:hypothetical protein n=1 Tax=Streptomyces sp. IBSNAI002 TaxID=3457500 RepID=UPI003FD06D56
MRYTRSALAIASTLLALTGLGTSAHANNNGDGKDHGGSNICFIHVEGNHNHNACGNIKYGHNATTGSGHSVLGQVQEINQAVLTNQTSLTLTVNSNGCQGPDGCSVSTSSGTSAVGPGQSVTIGGLWGSSSWPYQLELDSEEYGSVYLKSEGTGSDCDVLSFPSTYSCQPANQNNHWNLIQSQG